jgi:hypothetical protein
MTVVGLPSRSAAAAVTAIRDAFRTASCPRTNTRITEPRFTGRVAGRSLAHADGREANDALNGGSSG